MVVLPFMANCLNLTPVTGCASVGFAPITMIQSVCFKSIIELVAAPVPNDFCIPKAVGE